MKMIRTILAFVAAAIAMAACTRVQLDRPESDEIRFQVAGYRSTVQSTKAIDDYKNEYAGVPFGAYTWYKGEDPADNAVFMTNQKVSYNSTTNIWAPEGTTFYWPKGGSLDFICYSPYNSSGVPAISENAISYGAWDVSANPDVDLLYADKMTGLTNNSNTYYYMGVPVLFRHALAKLGFSVQLAYSEQTPATGDKTKWEVAVNSITLKDVRQSGSLDISLDSYGSWELPAGRVWTSDGSKTDISLDCSGLTLFTDTTPQDLGSFLVLPQTLDQGQNLVLNLTISTWHDNGSGFGSTPLIVETSVEVGASLAGIALPQWGINQCVKYNLILAPSLADTSNQPTQITFDPAVADWETVELNAIINI